MSFYGIKDNKCLIDLTERTPEIATIEDLGYTKDTKIESIVSQMNTNGILVYSVSNTSNLNIYPVKIPADDSAIVIIHKVGNSAIISFYFYDSFYTNHYSYGNLVSWIKVSKIELPQVEFRNIPSGYNFDHVEDLSPYGITDSAHINVTLLTPNTFIGGKPKIDFIYYVKYGKLYLNCKNNGSSSLASVKFNICIL